MYLNQQFYVFSVLTCKFFGHAAMHFFCIKNTIILGYWDRTMEDKVISSPIMIMQFIETKLLSTNLGTIICPLGEEGCEGEIDF